MSDWQILTCVHVCASQWLRGAGILQQPSCSVVHAPPGVPVLLSHFCAGNTLPAPENGACLPASGFCDMQLSWDLTHRWWVQTSCLPGTRLRCLMRKVGHHDWHVSEAAAVSTRERPAVWQPGCVLVTITHGYPVLVAQGTTPLSSHTPTPSTSACLTW
jgi:hypothetical protein